MARTPAMLPFVMKWWSVRQRLRRHKAMERLQKKQPDLKIDPGKAQDFFFIKSNGKIVKNNYDDLLFAEAQGNYIKIASSNSTTVTNMTFAGFKELLPENIFIRVHRSFIINKSKISHVDGNTFIDKSAIPIGSNYRESLLKNLIS